MVITISEIRDIINLTETGELSDVAIQSAIDRAEVFISDLASRSSASAAIIALAKKNYAAYLAYQTYADRIIEELPGSFDQVGVFNPIANPLARQVLAKLDGLKETSDEIIDLVRNSSLAASLDETPMPSDLEYYPEAMKISNLDTTW
jgi:hypothetical protein